MRTAVRLGGLALAGAIAWKRLRRTRLDLEDRAVLITGGSRGLGLVLARELAARGCRLVLCARDPRELEQARVELALDGAEVLALAADVSRPQDVEGMVRAATERFGRIDVIVNNASIIQVGPLETMTAADFERAMAVNFGGMLHTILAVLPQMRARGEGRIVNITSIGGKVAVPHLLPYSTAKFAAVALSEGLRAELAREGIVVTTIVPGLMRTGSPPNALFKGRRDLEFTWFSLGDALPLTAMSAERAARRIVLAMERGESEVVLSWQAKLVRMAHALAPGMFSDAMGLVNRLLPRAPGRGTEEESVPGMHLATPLAPSRLTSLMNEAAVRNNEFGGIRRPSREHARRIGLGEPSGDGVPRDS